MEKNCGEAKVIYFTSDEHFFHNNVISHCSRPFKDIGYMNEELIRRHNSVVNSTDTVYHLGDFTLSKTAVTHILPKLNGTHHLIAGNHDACHPVHAKTPLKLQNARKKYFDAGFSTIELEATMTIGGKQVLLSHFPYFDDNPNYDQRYPKLRPKDEGKILLHGHVHTTWKTKLSSKDTLMINIGVDQWNFYPVKIEEIEKLIELDIAMKS